MLSRALLFSSSTYNNISASKTDKSLPVRGALRLVGDNGVIVLRLAGENFWELAHHGCCRQLAHHDWIRVEMD